MLRIIFVLPVIFLLSACESIKDALGPQEPKEEVETPPVEAPVEPEPVEPEAPMTAAEARAALNDRGIPYS